MSKILIISCVFPPEPLVSANLSFDIALELSKNHIVTVISPKPSRPLGYDFSNTLKNYYLFDHKIINSYTHPKSSIFGRFYESWSFGLKCMKFIKENKNSIDFIYANTWPLFAQYFIVREANKQKVPILMHIQDIYPESLMHKLPFFLKKIVFQILFPLEKFVMLNSTKIVTISNGMKDFLISSRNIKCDKIKVIYNWQDETKFSINNSIYSNSPIEKKIHFMFLGSLGPVASLDSLLESFSNLKNYNINLTIAGDGSEKLRLKNIAKKLNLNNISFTSAKSSEVPVIQSQADVLILSLSKGAAKYALPSKLPAYMFSAKPILAIVDKESDSAKVIEDSGCGWIVEPQNVFALREKIIEVHSIKKEILNRMGILGQVYSLKNFSKKINVDKLTNTILDLNGDKV